MKTKRFKFEPLYSGSVLHIDKFDLPVVLDLEGADLTELPVPACLEHIEEARVGTIDRVEIRTDSRGRKSLHASGTFDLEASGAPVPPARYVLAEKKAGKVWEGSIHTRALWTFDIEKIPPGEAASANGQTFIGPVLIARRWKLKEGSFVELGGDAGNRAEVLAKFKQKGKNMSEELKAYIQSLNFNPDEMEAEQLAIFERCLIDKNAALQTADAAANLDEEEAAAGLDEDGNPIGAANLDEEEADASLEEEEADASLEEDASNGSTSNGSASNGSTTNGANRKAGAGFSLDETGRKPEAAANLRRRNPARGFGRASTPRLAGAPTRNRAYAAAILISEGGLKADEVKAAGKFTDDEMTLAESGAFRGATYGAMLAEVYERSTGRVYRGQKDDVAAFTMRGMLAPELMASAGFSTRDAMAIFDATFQIAYKAGWESYSPKIDQICSHTQADTLLPTRYFTFDIAPPNETELPNGGEIQNANLVSEAWTNQAKTHAMNITISEDDFINDTTGALLRTQRKAGLKANRAKDFNGMRVLLANLDTLFTTERGNRVSGTLSLESLGKMVQALATMETIGSTTANPEFTEELGKFLLVPPGLLPDAQIIYRDSKCDLVGFGGEYLESNPYVGQFEPIGMAQFGAKAPGGSDSHAILIGDPMNAAVLDFCELRGQSGPRVLRLPAPPHILGFVYQTTYRYGYAIGDYRGGVYLDGVE